MSVHGCPQEDTEILAGQFMTLHVRNDQTLSNPHLRHKDNSPGRKKDVAHAVNFEERIYDVEEQDVLREYIERAYDSREHHTYFMQNAKPPSQTVDCSNIYVGNAPKGKICRGFCINMGAPKSVVEKLQLNCILKNLGRRYIQMITPLNDFVSAMLPLNLWECLSLSADMLGLNAFHLKRM